MDSVAKQVRERTPLKVKLLKQFQISGDHKSKFTLEVNLFNDYGLYFGINKSWKRPGDDFWKHANSINLPLKFWKNFLEVIPEATNEIGMKTEHPNINQSYNS